MLGVTKEEAMLDRYVLNVHTLPVVIYITNPVAIPTTLKLDGHLG